MAYSDQVMDHYVNPRNVGKLDAEDNQVGTGMVGAPACGDVMKLQIKVEKDIIQDAVFKCYGCGSAIASSSIITEMLKGMTVDEAKEIANSTSLNDLFKNWKRVNSSSVSYKKKTDPVINMKTGEPYRTKKEVDNSNNKKDDNKTKKVKSNKDKYSTYYKLMKKLHLML